MKKISKLLCAFCLFFVCAMCLLTACNDGNQRNADDLVGVYNLKQMTV